LRPSREESEGRRGSWTCWAERSSVFSFARVDSELLSSTSFQINIDHSDGDSFDGSLGSGKLLVERRAVILDLVDDGGTHDPSSSKLIFLSNGDGSGSGDV